MRLRTLIPVAFAAALNFAAQVNSTPAEPVGLLPDGTPFPGWSDRTRYGRTYHVNNRHPQAADGNPGSEALPFRTINRAAGQQSGPRPEAVLAGSGHCSEENLT